MHLLRNVSDQAIMIQKQGGAALHLLPGRAATLTDEEMKSPQVLHLLQTGLVEFQGLLGKAAGPGAKGEEETGKKSEKKTGGDKEAGSG